MEELLKSNIARWRLFCPKAAEEIFNGWARKSEERPLDSDYQEKVPIQFNDDDLDRVELIYIYGVGHGEAFDQLLGWLDEERHQLVFIESEIDVIRALLSSAKGAEIVNHSAVWLHYTDFSLPNIDAISDSFVGLTYAIYSSHHYASGKKEEFKQLSSSIAFYSKLKEQQQAEFKNCAVEYTVNYFHNLALWPSSYSGDRLFNKFFNVPAIICGAGPSLAKNGPLLADLKERALIFAGGTALNALNGYNIQPHFGIGIDPNREFQSRTIMNTAYETPFFFRNRVYHDALKQIHAPRLFVTGSMGYEISRYFEELIGLPSFPPLEEGCNVVNFSLVLAAAMGCNPIICVGIDLAYSQNLSYSPSVLSHPLYGGSETLRTKGESEELIARRDIFGQPILTLWKWVAESLWYTHFQLSHSNLMLINATEGGLGFPEIANMTLMEAAERHLAEPLNLTLRVHAEMQNSPMAMKNRSAPIVEGLKNLHSSLVSSSGKLNECLLEPAGNSALIEKRVGEKLAPAAEKVVEELLSDQLAYRYLLKTLNSSFSDIKKRDFFRIEVDWEKHSEQQNSERLSKLHRERISYLSRAAQLNGLIVERVLATAPFVEAEGEFSAQGDGDMGAEDKSARSSAQKALEASLEGCSYHFQENRLRLFDRECALDLNELFAPSESETSKLHYDNGSLKGVWYRRNGKLHGPSAFYSEGGALIAESWHCDGKKVGKEFRYYLSGALYAINRYVNGVEEGVQEYYYENGHLKTSMPCSLGVFDGSVELYYPSGQIKRKVTFAGGKRNGIEQSFSEEGALLIEVHYKNEIPTGLARLWYPSGEIAIEREYDVEGYCCSVKKWDPNGNIQGDLDGKSTDYFKQVAYQTDTLTHAVTTLAAQVSALPASESVESEADLKAVEGGALLGDFAELNAEIEKLQQLSKELSFEAGIDGRNPKEAIWKSPSLQRELEQQLKEHSKEIDRDFLQLQRAFKELLDRMANDGDSDQGI